MLLPGEESVVNVEGTGSDLDRSLHTLRRQASVEIATFAVQSLGPVVARAHLKLDAVEAETACLLLGCQGETGCDAAASMRRPYQDILQFWWIREGQMGVAKRVALLPCHQVVAVTLVKSR